MKKIYFNFNDSIQSMRSLDRNLLGNFFKLLIHASLFSALNFGNAVLAKFVHQRRQKYRLINKTKWLVRHFLYKFIAKSPLKEIPEHLSRAAKISQNYYVINTHIKYAYSDIRTNFIRTSGFKGQKVQIILITLQLSKSHFLKKFVNKQLILLFLLNPKNILRTCFSLKSASKVGRLCQQMHSCFAYFSGF